MKERPNNKSILTFLLSFLLPPLPSPLPSLSILTYAVEWNGVGGGRLGGGGGEAVDDFHEALGSEGHGVCWFDPTVD